MSLAELVLEKERGSDNEVYKKLHWEGSFNSYLELVESNPMIVRTAFQRIYDMITSYGHEVIEDARKEKIIKYRFFEDPIENGKDAIFGLDEYLTKLVDVFKAAAQEYGVEKRLFLLHGPVGSSKSTVARLLKKGLEAYSKTDEGALYTFGWKDEKEDNEVIDCPMHEEPLNLIPVGFRKELEERLNSDIEENAYRVSINGKLCPPCRQEFRERLKRYEGNWRLVLNDIIVKRLTLSEEDRIGIGTFQPKDEKNQDSTELTGDINYRKIAVYGSDSDPRAFNFDGELNIGNRGMVELIEMLKLDVAFLYDLLGASQEHVIKPKKFQQVSIDEVLLGHTNEPEYKRLQSNEFMEALRDRTVKIDIPYVTRLSEEIRIYEKDYNKEKVRRKHIAPHALEIASMWSILTRLEPPKNAQLSLLQKLKLYDGKVIPGFTPENVKELREEAEKEGMSGISPRYVQDKISNALVNINVDEKCVNPFMILNELESGLKHHSLIINEQQRKQYKDLLAVVTEEYEDIVKDEVRKAISADEEAMGKLCGNYMDHVRAYTQKEKVRNKFTGQNENPDEKLMRSVEEKINIEVSRKDDFRQQIMNYIGALSLEGKRFDYKSNERLRKALELKLFEDQKDSIKLTSLVSNIVDKETQEKIDVVKARMIRDYGYCEVCSTDVLHFVASIFARGVVKK